MYVNKCIKCGREFETKNPKRVICPDCLYPDKKMMINAPSDSGSSTDASVPAEEPLKGYSAGGVEEPPRYYSAGGNDDTQRYSRPQRTYNQNSYNRDNRYSRQGYSRPQQGFNRNKQSGYNKNRPQQGGYNKNNFGNRRPQGGNFNKGGFNKRPMKKAPKQLLVSKEQLEQIEALYKAMLPLPNPDCHEVIGEKIGLEPRKVFFGINLVRQKLMLPKLPFPKRKLAISPDQLFAIKNLYEPLLPLPPIGCHKIIAAQLKMDEWRVHVGIGLIRSQMGLDRWNQDRPDLPEEFKKQKEEAKQEIPADGSASTEENTDKTAQAEEVKPKRGRKPKKVEETPEA